MSCVSARRAAASRSRSRSSSELGWTRPWLLSLSSRPILPLQVRGYPIGDMIDADLPVVGLRMIRAAVLGSENLQALAPGADRLEELVGGGDRHDLVVLGVHDEKRAGDLVRDSREREALGPLDRRVDVLGPHDPAEMKARLRGRLRVGLVFALDLALPCREVPVQRAHRHARAIALLERGDAGGVIAAEAVAHDHHLLRIDLPPPG